MSLLFDRMMKNEEELKRLLVANEQAHCNQMALIEQKLNFLEREENSQRGD